MNNSVAGWLPSFLIVAAILAWGTVSSAEPIEVPKFLFVDGSSRLKVKKVGRFNGATIGRIDFKLAGQPENRCAFQLDPLLTLVGDCVYSQNNRVVRMTPDPESAEKALFTFLEPSIFQSALRGVERGTMSLKIKLRQKKGEVTAKVRFKMGFIALLALPPETLLESVVDPDAEVVEPFKMKYRYKGKTPPSQ